MMTFKTPSKSVFQSRKLFYSCQRQKFENIELWLLRLKHTIIPCEYESLMEFLLIDKFLSGLNYEDFAIFARYASWTEESLLEFVTGSKLHVPNDSTVEMASCFQPQNIVKKEENLDIFSESHFRSSNIVGVTNDSGQMKHSPVDKDDSIKEVVIEKTPKLGPEIDNREAQAISLVELKIGTKEEDLGSPILRPKVKRGDHIHSYICHLCQIDYYCRSKLEVHMRQHQHIGKSFDCYLCGMQFHRLLALKVHFSRIHVRQKKQRLSCTECEKSFLERVALDRHIRIHKGLAQVHRCPKCDKEFDLRCRMLAHFEIHSDNRQEHICETCGQIYRSRKLLNMHRKTHSDMRYKCQVCGLLLKNSNTYCIHQRQHTGERPHQCSLCPKTFVTAPSYKKHLMVHNKIKPHACYICSGRFATPYHLKVHLNRHTGEKPYQCSQCATRFSQPQSLNTHNKRFHSNDTSN